MKAGERTVPDEIHRCLRLIRRRDLVASKDLLDGCFRLSSGRKVKSSESETAASVEILAIVRKTQRHDSATEIHLQVSTIYCRSP
jgi:hypothetical protein